MIKRLAVFIPSVLAAGAIAVSLVTVSSAAAVFPSVLHACGTALCDSAGTVLSQMKGFNIQLGGPSGWPQTYFDAMKTEGAKIERFAVFWDRLQDTNCSAISSAGATYLSEVATQIKRAANDGIYTELDLHLVPGAFPACASGTSGTTMDKYMTNGKFITQYLANYFGNPSSSTYNKSVIGFGLNEPPQRATSTQATWNTIMEQDQSTMISWFRGPGGVGGAAPQWIGFVAYISSSSTPIFNDAFTGQKNQCATCANANPHAYDAVGKNVVLDLHDYVLGCEPSWKTSTGLPMSDCDGRSSNGLPYSTAKGGYLLSTAGGGNYPCCGLTRATSKSEQVAYLKPYKDFARQANIPLMIGETGWNPNVDGTGAVNWANDQKAHWADTTFGPNPAVEMEWVFDTNPANDGFAAYPNQVWQAFTNALFA